MKRGKKIQQILLKQSKIHPFFHIRGMFAAKCIALQLTCKQLIQTDISIPKEQNLLNNVINVILSE